MASRSMREELSLFESNTIGPSGQYSRDELLSLE